ncbi:MAG TPA: hypothetical protein VFC50_04035 [Candidatus Dormibacteraeota bacterium]|nr:hypothetical protein [Candidatus Dormibacteraeota bacterium]
MRKNNNTIEINGKLYDASTGALLNSPTPKPNKAEAQPPTRHEQPAPRTSKPALSNVSRKPAKRSSSHAPSSSRTLMRQAVKKPGSSLKRQHKAQGDTDALALRQLRKVIVKPSISRLDEQRLRHAEQIPKSRMISRFPSITSDAFSNGPSPAKSVAAASAAKANLAPGRDLPARPAQPAKKPRTTADILERAVEQATSHLEPPPPRQKYRRRHDRLKRNTGIGASIGLSVLVLGIIVAQNLSSVRLQMASSKAGFNVSLPNYHPAGYDLGQLNYSQGVAAAQFRSSSDSNQYTITQKSSSWDSSALLDNFVSPSYAQYQTISAKGLTIYIYGTKNATWVNGGVWYVIQSNGLLSDRQLVDLATSV